MAIPESIKKKANQVRNEVYGKDVREALASGIEEAGDIADKANTKSNDAVEQVDNIQAQVNQLVVEGDSSVEAAQARVDAEGKSYPTLKARLDAKETEFSSQLAQTEDKIDNEKQDMLRRLNDLSVSQINKNKGLFDETYFSDEVKQQWAGNTPIHSVPAKKSITHDKLAEKAITAENTTFAEKGKNLFSGYFERDLVISGGTGSGTITQQKGAISAVIKTGTGTFTVSRESNINDRFRIAASSKYPEVGDSVRLFPFDDSQLNQTVTLEDDEEYLIVYLSSPTQSQEPLKFQVERGSSKTEYESPYIANIKFGKHAISLESIDQIRPVGYLSGRGESFDVRLYEEKIITTESANFINVGNKRYGFLGGVWDYSTTGSQSVAVCFDIKDKQIKFFSTTEILTPQNVNLVFLGIIRRDTKEVFLNGLYTVNGSKVIPFTETIYNELKTEKVSNDSEIFIADSVSGNYKSEMDYVPKERDIQLVYDLYDDGVSIDPSYATKTFLKNDEGGLPLYKYELKPVGMRTEIKLPKIIYTCTHGHENSATYGGAIFFRDLMMNWRDNPILKFLRWNVHFVIIPNLNPWGFNNNSRLNFNGVDLARNFSDGWNPEYNDIGYDYPGTAPLTEVGTQVFDQLLQDHSDALFAIDHHNFGGDPQSGAELLWVGTSNADIKDLQDQYTYNMVVQSKINFGIEENLKLGRSIIYNRGGSTCRQIYYRGIDGIILECSHTIYGSHEDGQKFNSNAVGNAILSALRYYSS